ncbi:MAG: PAQR family membrane homeostasis protein TrhA [Thermincolia bacterium]
METRRYSLAEEIFNALTHGVGTLFAVSALTLMIVFASFYGSALHIVSVSIYGTTMVLLYLASTLYHSLTNERAKDIFKLLDHAAIFLLIAGTYTPFLLVTLGGVLGWSLLIIVWIIAILGIVFKVFFIKRFQILSTLIYLAMGWLVVIAIKPLIAALPIAGFRLLMAGGLSYTLGSVFYIRKSKAFNHGIWHLFVLGGSVCHFLAVLLYVLPGKNENVLNFM